MRPDGEHPLSNVGVYEFLFDFASLLSYERHTMGNK